MTSRTTDRHALSAFTKSLPVRLTQDELLDRAAELAGVVEDYSTEEARQTDVKAQLKARLTELDAKRRQLAIVVARKEEYRDVRCEVLADLDRMLAHTMRTDTGEIVGSRPLTDEERQDGLPLE